MTKPNTEPKTYTFSTFQELIDRVPHDRISECFRELGIVFSSAKATSELLYLTAASLAAKDGVSLPEMPERLFEVPSELEWVDDGKGELGVTLGGFSDGQSIELAFTPAPAQSPSEPAPSAPAANG